MRKAVPGRFTSVASERSETAFTNKNYFMRNKEAKTDDFQKNADDILLQKYTPAGVVVNDQFDIVQFRGSTGEYLEPSPGKASLNVLKMAKEGLAFEIRNGLHKAKASSEPFIKEGVPINGGKKLVTISVIPLLNTLDLHFLILFREDTPTGNEQLITGNEKNITAKIKKDEKDIRIQQLEKELARLREDMHSITEDQEAANEELQSSNEELLSGSEELQSLNEELETSKEEIQSTNEELITVNQELYDRNDELNQSRNFAEATLSVLHEPLLVLDKNFIIKSANQSFYKTFQLTEEDTLGIFLFQLQNNSWDVPGLRKELGKIQKEKEKMLEMELTFTFPVIGERILCVNLRPIQKENGEQLILLALDDITRRKNAEKILMEKADGLLKEHQLLHRYLMESPAPFVILKGPEHIFEFANSSYHQLIGNRDLLGKKMMEAIPELKGQGYLEIVDEVYRSGKPYLGAEMPAFIEKVKGKPEQIYVNLHCQPIENEQGIIEGILVFSYDVTELVLGRKYLERNAEMLQNLYLNAPAYVATLNGPTHIYDLVNPSYQNLFGSREITGKPILEALPELKGQGFDKLLDNVYNTGEIFVGNEMLTWLAYDKGLEPAERYFNFSYQPIYDFDKKITGILVFGYEVTEQVLARKMQVENAERFRILADAMPQKMWTADENGNVNYFNRQWFEYTYKTFEELKGWGWEKIIHPDDRNQNKKSWIKSINSGEDFELEHRFLHHDGSYHWHLSRGHAQKDAAGKVQVWIGTHTDIDDQKIASEKIRIAEEFSRTVLQSSPDCVKVLDKEGHIFFMNTNGLCLMEIDDFNIIKNRPWREMWGPDLQPTIDAALATALAGKTAQFQAYRTTMKGNPKWWDVILSPIFDSDGKVFQLITVSRDITDRIKTEQKKDEFISIASHEMKTPLTTAKAYLQLLELSLGTENETANLYAKKASLSVARLNGLITELIDVSKIQHGKLDYTISTFDFNDMLDTTVQDIQHSTTTHTLIKTGRLAHTVTGDKDRLQQVIINLLNNAIKYSPNAFLVFIHIEEQNGEIHLSVKDDGIGISKEHLKKVFERYYRVEEHAIQFQGLGIGLFISCEIIRRHHGQLWAASEEGKGTTFHFTLPLNNE